MGWQFTILAIPTLLALAVSLLIVVYIVVAYRDHREDPLVVLYFWITVAAIVWVGFSLLKLLHTDLSTKLLFFRLLHIGAATLPPLTFLFVVAFTDRTHWLRSDVIGLLFVVPVVFLVLLFFGPSGLALGKQRLIEGDLVILRVSNGPGFTVFALYSILLVVATLVLVLLEARRAGPSYYPQALLIAVAVATPMVFSTMTTAELYPFTDDRINLVPTAGAVSTVAFGILLYRYRLVDLPPLAYATAMKYSPDALFVLDTDERVVSANDHGTELLDNLGGVLGDPLPEHLWTVDSETISNELVELTATADERAYFRVFREPLTRGGRQIGWVVVLRDETEQQRQHQRLQQKNAQTELLTSTISHDLRNPLNVAQLNLQLAQDEFDAEELERVATAHKRMEEIIEDVLALARAGKQVDSLEPVPLANTVEQAWQNVSTADGTLTVDVERTIMADPTMIQHVFENLFRNAVEHGSTSNQTESDDSVEHGGSNVSVTVGLLEDGLYVEDDGPGVPPDKRDDVFEVGYTNSTEGTGFGLTIIEQVVTAHGWDIHLTESSDGGARFEITGIDEYE
jgi:signal transduction histidine kinase